VTVVVWDGKTLAADKLMLSTTGQKTRGTKIKKIGKGLVGYSGPMSLCGEFFKWLEEDKVMEKAPAKHIHKDDGGTAMVITAKREIFVFDHSFVPFQVEATCHAIGAGAIAARVALHLGHKSREIVLAVSEHDILCGMGVDTLTFTSRRRTS
jgi:hypothetical protein